MTDSTHAKLAPSAAKRWMNCPSSVPLSAGIGDTESPAAAEGTFAHHWAAECLQQKCDASAFVGKSDGVHTLDEEMADHIQTYLDAVRMVGMIFSVDVVRVLVEERVRLVGVFEQIYGTADALVFSDEGRRMDVFDLKFGRGVFVDVEDNPQLKIYALGALLTFEKLQAKVETVGLHIVQPRHRTGPAWRYVELSAAELMLRFSDEVRGAANKAAGCGPGDALEPGDWCQFCPAKPRCPALQERALTAAAAAFDDVSELKPVAQVPDAQLLTDGDLSKALKAFPMVEEWINTVRAEAYKRANGGRKIVGFKLVSKTGNRKWKNEQTAAAELSVLGIDPYADPKLVSPAEAERRLGRGLKRHVDDLVFKPSTGTTLVPEKDKRAEHNPGDVFGAID